jgi:hypothetical protein
MKSEIAAAEIDQESILNISIADGGIKAVVNKVNSLPLG